MRTAWPRSCRSLLKDGGDDALRLVDALRVRVQPRAPLAGEDELREPRRLLVAPRDTRRFELAGDLVGDFVGELAEVVGGHASFYPTGAERVTASIARVTCAT